MAKSFTETEKRNIREKLLAECEKSWAVFGYKKTSLDELCAKTGISKGAFYAFFDSKEHLFCEVSDVIQARQYSIIKTVPEFPVKEDICRMLKLLYLDYDKTNIHKQVNSSDFISFLNRAPEEWTEKYKKNSDESILITVLNPNLKLRISNEKAIGIFNALLAIVITKDMLGYDHYEIFCTLLDNVINEIYE
jgi:AcrR family transcriptional regulator